MSHRCQTWWLKTTIVLNYTQKLLFWGFLLITETEPEEQLKIRRTKAREKLWAWWKHFNSPEKERTIQTKAPLKCRSSLPADSLGSSSGSDVALPRLPCQQQRGTKPKRFFHTMTFRSCSALLICGTWCERRASFGPNGHIGFELAEQKRSIGHCYKVETNLAPQIGTQIKVHFPFTPRSQLRWVQLAAAAQMFKNVEDDFQSRLWKCAPLPIFKIFKWGRLPMPRANFN